MQEKTLAEYVRWNEKNDKRTKAVGFALIAALDKKEGKSNANGR